LQEKHPHAFTWMHQVSETCYALQDHKISCQISVIIKPFCLIRASQKKLLPNLISPHPGNDLAKFIGLWLDVLFPEINALLQLIFAPCTGS